MHSASLIAIPLYADWFKDIWHWQQLGGLLLYSDAVAQIEDHGTVLWNMNRDFHGKEILQKCHSQTQTHQSLDISHGVGQRVTLFRAETIY